VGSVKVTLERSLAGSPTPEEAIHSIMPCSIGDHFPFPIALSRQPDT
jgi:hypothetical protein